MTADFSDAGRIIVITGHYGSGKTEFAVSLAMLLARNRELASEPQTERRYNKLALVDLDIVNPYFRSREQREMLEETGISVYGSAFTTEVTAELPALGADVRTPLEAPDCRVIIDAGGNDAGALVLNQFRKYLTGCDTTVLAVVNANRPETRDTRGALSHIASIEDAIGLTVTGVVNNCHLSRETTAAEIAKGHALCTELCEASGRRLWCDCFPVGVVDPEELSGFSQNFMPLGLFMRPSWLDR